MLVGNPLSVAHLSLLFWFSSCVLSVIFVTLLSPSLVDEQSWSLIWGTSCLPAETSNWLKVAHSLCLPVGCWSPLFPECAPSFAGQRVRFKIPCSSRLHYRIWSCTELSAASSCDVRKKKETERERRKCLGKGKKTEEWKLENNFGNLKNDKIVYASHWSQWLSY